MKKFLLAMRDLKTRSNKLDVKLVWNQNSFNGSNWLVTTVFSKRFIEAKGLEVVYG